MKNYNLVTDFFLFADDDESVQDILLIYRDGKYLIPTNQPKLDMTHFNEKSTMHYLGTENKIKKLIAVLNLDATVENVLADNNINEIILNSETNSKFIYLMSYFKLQLFNSYYNEGKFTDDLFCSFVNNLEIEDNDILVKLNVTLNDIVHFSNQQLFINDIEYYGYNNQNEIFYKIKSTEDLEEELSNYDDEIIQKVISKAVQNLLAINFIFSERGASFEDK